MKNILVVAELAGTGVRSTTLSAITAAQQLAQALGGSFSILALGHDPAGAAEELRKFGAQQVLICKDPSLERYLAERFAPCVAATAASFDVVVGTASSYGKDLLPRVAGRLDAAYLADCSELTAQGGELVAKRPMYAGNAYGYCTPTSPKVVVSVRQSEFDPAAPGGGTDSELQEHPVAAPGEAASRVEFVSLDTVESGRPELTEARVVVSGGRALKEKFFPVIEPLADALGAAIGASRAACDAGYAPGDFQVGQTGKVVAPELYFAIGISGAIQHIAGMKGSKTIVAINKDPDAPIFQIADYGLVQDLFQAVPELVEALKKRA